MGIKNDRKKKKKLAKSHHTSKYPTTSLRQEEARIEDAVAQLREEAKKC